MRSIRNLLLIFLLAAAFAPGLARADTVTTKDGRVLEGEVIEDTETTVKIRTATGTVTLRRSEVRDVAYKESPLQAYEKRKKALASDDAKGRWELAQHCLANNLRRQSEELLGEIRTMASPFYVQATRKLAEILAPREPIAAIELLDDLAAKTADLEAQVKARELKRDLDKRRQTAYDEAQGYMQKRDWAQAVATLKFAHALSYAGPQASEGPDAPVTRAQVLAKLAEVRQTMEGIARGELTAAGNEVDTAKVITCTVCTKHAGVGACAACKGAGTVERIIPAVITLNGVKPERRVQVTCPTCQGTKLGRCTACAGSGLEINQLESRMRFPVRALADRAWTRNYPDALTGMKDCFALAQQRKVTLPPGFVPDYPSSKNLRDALPGVPVPDDFGNGGSAANLEALWKAAKPEVRGNFLCSYAFEAVQNAQPAAGELSGAADPANALAAPPDLGKMRASAPTVGATELSALPETWAGRWVWVAGTYDGPDASLSAKDRLALQIKTDAPNNLHPFVFRAEAKDLHAKAAGENSAPPLLKLLAANYPYADVAAKAGDLRTGDTFQALGRVIYSKDRNPETCLEVWDLMVRADPKTRELLERVRMPVTFNFQDTPLAEGAQLLTLLTGTKIRVDAKQAGELPLSVRTTERPLAEALNEMAKAANVAWVFDEDNGVRIVAAAKPDEQARVEQVMRYLK
ncbi:MAG: hypothetical protein L6R28_03305 [Planctomycetes bacterium]|nr:hypothetical protein [Planctomycetota bacterium]